MNKKGGQSVMDLGSGSGKFCLIAGSISDAKIIGVEQRESLVQLSRKLSKKYDLADVTFIHEDIKNLDFKAYDAF